MGKGVSWTKDDALLAISMKNQGKTNRQIGKALGKSTQAVQDAWRRNRLLRSVMAGDDIYEKKREPYMTSRLAAGKEVAFHRVQANRPYSEPEFMELFGVDPERWTPYGKMEHTQWGNNFRTVMRFAPNLPGMVASEKWSELLDLIKSKAPFHIHDGTDVVHSGILYLIEILDAHLGMMSWGPETGNDWDLSLALQEYRMAFRSLLRSRPDDTERLVLRFGDDLLQYDKLQDGKTATTFKGTPQDIDSRYPKLYGAVAKMLVELVLEALEVVHDVEVIILPGNHDTHSCFTLGELVTARFWNDERVTVNNEPQEFKVYRWGANLIGMAHGTGGKRDFLALPDTLKSRARAAWGETKYAEIHTGDKHHEFAMDDRMVLMRKLKALCPNDKWHTDQQYDSYRGAQAFSYSKAPGIRSQEYYHSSFQFSDKHSLPILGDG
jgi:hypothetical protein